MHSSECCHYVCGLGSNSFSSTVSHLDLVKRGCCGLGSYLGPLIHFCPPLPLGLSKAWLLRAGFLPWASNSFSSTVSHLDLVKRGCCGLGSYLVHCLPLGFSEAWLLWAGFLPWASNSFSSTVSHLDLAKRGCCGLGSYLGPLTHFRPLSPTWI